MNIFRSFFIHNNLLIYNDGNISVSWSFSSHNNCKRVFTLLTENNNLAGGELDQLISVHPTIIDAKIAYLLNTPDAKNYILNNQGLINEHMIYSLGQNFWDEKLK
jgi:hypothetical protein